MIRSLATATLAALALASPAQAEQVEITAQAKAARAAFLLTAIPPGPPAAICLIDTGVNDTPDTQSVVARFSLQGALNDRSPTLHGTQMASFIGAARNDYGMVGLWPAARIVSVRANTDGAESFTGPSVVHGVRLCDDVAGAYSIKVVLLALSSPVEFGDEALTEFNDAIQTVKAHGMNVVSAAGNTSGAPVTTPAGLDGVLSIGAVDAETGSACGFSAVGAALSAPGCGVDGALPGTGAPTVTQQGTSVSSAIVAAGLAALRTWRPDLSADAAEAVLRTSSSAGRLDLAAAFAATGYPIQPEPSLPSPPQPTPETTTSPDAGRRDRDRMPKPRVAIRTRGSGTTRALIVNVSNRPRGARVRVQVFGIGKGSRLRRVASQTRQSSTITIRIRGWRRATVVFIDPTGSKRASLATVVSR